ncbi:MFS transporter [Chloroflexota bacterium]
MANQDVRQPHISEPRFFHGHHVVVASFFTIMVSFGLYSSFGIFFKPLVVEFGWTRTMVSGAYSLSVILHGMLAIIMGGLSDRYGPRLVVTLCGIILGLGYVLMSQVNTVWQLYLFYGVIIGIGMSGVWVPILSTIARWFIRRRTLMSGIVIAGAGIGIFILPPVVSRLIAIYDWRASYVILGIVVSMVMVVAAQFLKRNPKQEWQSPYGEGGNEGKRPVLESENAALSLKEAIHTMQFWMIFIILSCFGFCMFAIMVHIVPHAIDLGTSAIIAANILAIRGATGILGNYILGGLGDRIGNGKIFIVGFILISASLIWLAVANEVWMLYLFAVAFGFAVGGMGASESPLVASLFGLRSHGLIYGVLSIGFTSGASVGPIVAGYIFDLKGSYLVAFWICAALGIVGLTSATILKPIRKSDG